MITAPANQPKWPFIVAYADRNSRANSGHLRQRTTYARPLLSLGPRPDPRIAQVGRVDGLPGLVPDHDNDGLRITLVPSQFILRNFR